MGHYGVHIAFHNYDALAPGGFLSQVEAIQQPALVKHRGAGGVQVLGHGIVQGAAAKATQLSLAVKNGNHQPAPKGVPIPPVLVLMHRPGLHQLFRRELLPPQVIEQPLPVPGG